MISTEMNSAAPMKRPKLSTDATMKAAGLMIVAKQGRALFLRRRNKGRFEGEWAWPGGKIENGETAEEAAIRETREEIKWEPESEVKEIDNNINDRGTDFTTFRTEVEDEFIPKLNEEHVGYAWASLDDPPEPLHPGCRRVIDMAMDALDKAKFEEGKHPRGQPENAGQFGPGGGGGGKAQPEAKAAPERPAERQEGETDKQFAKRVVDKRPPPKELPENYNDYFNTEGAQVIPLDKLVSAKSDEENVQGAENGAKRMEAAAKGELGKRGPIEVQKMPDGRFQIVDGNGTYSSVKKYGWKGIPAKLSEVKTSFKPGIAAQGLENATAKKKQWAEISPIKTAEDLWSEGAVKNQEALAKVSAPIAQKLGLMFKDPGIKGASDKGKARIQEKIEEGKPPNRINDGVRAGFRINTPGQADKIVEGLSKHFEIADEGWEVTDVGYFDRKVMVRFEDGQVGEVQIWHPELLDVKENKGHKLYEDWRTLRKQMATGEIPPDDPRSGQLVKQMREVYSQVHKGMSPDWLSLLGRGGSVPMEGGAGKPGNMDSKRALDSKAACIDTSILGASRHAPLRNTNAFSGPGKYNAGSPSHEQYLIDSSVILDSFQILKRFENRIPSTYAFDDKISKEEARYTDGPVDTEPCKRCSMYRDLFCTAITGEISPNGHCKLWESKGVQPAMDLDANEATEKELRTTIKYPPSKSNSPRVIDQSFARGGLKQGESLHYAPKAQAYENRGGHDSVAKDQIFTLAYDKSILVNLGNGLYVKAPRECLAFDARTARFYDKDGRLHLAVSNISKAVVNPYLGKEIPEFEQLGLEPNRIYRLYRDPEELAKAAPTFNGIPVLSEHVAVDAMNHRPDLVIGATGTDANFANPYLQNSLVFWDGQAIEDIESEDKKELSSAYRYRFDPSPGEVNGERFDGVMRDIVANHVALVKEGRAGNDVVVGDSKASIDRIALDEAVAWILIEKSLTDFIRCASIYGAF